MINRHKDLFADGLFYNYLAWFSYDYVDFAFLDFILYYPAY